MARIINIINIHVCDAQCMIYMYIKPTSLACRFHYVLQNHGSEIKAQMEYSDPRTAFPPGEVLTADILKDPATCFAERWVLGTCIGEGAFGEIYLAKPESSDASLVGAKHVVKVIWFCVPRDVINDTPSMQQVGRSLMMELLVYRYVRRYSECVF